MSDTCSVIFDHLETDPNWKVNNTTAVNPIPFDYTPPVPPYITSGAMAGSLQFMGYYSQNYAGALISQDISLPVIGTRKFYYAALNIKAFIPAYPDQTVVREEMDLKWTLASGSTTPVANQANGSTQINTQTGMWQLDPTGAAWVDSGYIPTTNKTGQANVYQIRLSSNGSVWSVLGLRCNAEPAFVPGSTFINIPLITTNWTAGLHPQLQWEGANAPFAATVYYQRVQVSTSDAPIPMLDSTTF